LATPDQESDVRGIEKLIKMSISLSEHPEIPAKPFFTGIRTPFQKKLGRHKRRMSRRPARRKR
jgi:hypothetical protein